MTYGCWNRQRPIAATLVVQDGYFASQAQGPAPFARVARHVEIASPFDLNWCEYTQTTVDRLCAGCVHEKVPAEINDQGGLK